MNLRRLVLAASLVPAVLFAACAPKQQAPRQKTSTLITGATLIDGTGQPGRAANVRIKADRIAEVGDLKPTDEDNVVDATGMVLAPGFIDTHSHHSRGLDKERGALAVVSQGITTIVVGQDGGSELPLAPYLDGFDKQSACHQSGELRRPRLGARQSDGRRLQAQGDPGRSRQDEGAGGRRHDAPAPSASRAASSTTPASSRRLRR